MTIRTSKLLGWRKNVRKDRAKASICQKPVVPVAVDSVATFPHGTSNMTGETFERTSLERAIWSLLLKGVQMSQ